jgi:hypothetical protein
VELSLDVIGPLYATIYLIPWYRMLGAKLGARTVGPIPDPAALSIVWRAAIRVLVRGASMRPFVSLSCSREDNRFKGSAPGSCSQRVQ